MLVALGFLFAMLLCLAIAPAYKRRTERLTTQAIRNAMPLTEAEIRADKDRLRAGFAIAIHDLEGRVEKTTQVAARQRVEINRRDAVISGLEGDVKHLGTSLEEHENARRVLEQTIMDRLPKVEQRLAEAKKMLVERDSEITSLTETAETQAAALEDLTQIDLKNRDEIHQLQAALNTRGARKRDGLADPRFDSEVALRSELESLRAKTRDQADLLAKLQANETGGALQSGEGTDGAAAGKAEIARLQKALAKAEAAVQEAQSSADAGADTRAELTSEVRRLKSVSEDQETEIKRLKAALDAYQESERKDQAMAEGKMAMKSRIAALQSQCEGQASQIQSLRAELAAANERLSRQASHYMDEMRRIGAGTRSPMGSSASSATNRDAAAVVANALRHGEGTSSEAELFTGARPEQAQQRSLTDRISEPRAGAALRHANTNAQSAGADAPPVSPTVAKVLQETGASSDVPEADTAATGAAKARRSGGLLERITRLDKAD